MNRQHYLSGISKPTIRWIECGDVWVFKGGSRKIPNYVKTDHKWWPKQIRIIANRGIVKGGVDDGVKGFYEVHAFYGENIVRIEEKLMLFPEWIYSLYE